MLVSSETGHLGLLARLRVAKTPRVAPLAVKVLGVAGGLLDRVRSSGLLKAASLLLAGYL